MQQEQQQWLAQLTQGDKRGLQQIFDCHYTNLCRSALRIVHRPEIAEEIVQDVLVHLWEKRDTLTVSISLSAYLNQAVRNRCLNHLKSRAARYDWADEITNYQHPVEVSPIDKLQASELHEAIAQILPQLPEKCWLIFSMIRYEERSYREIAEQLNVSVKTVEYYMSKALRLIREHLSRYGYGWIGVDFLKFLSGESGFPLS
ncbi:MAG: RNA polymerase sigma-70 factor [Tunicatimonas sp.]|uniref:RNA polymerase sigma-70 factor n=1 Tax=Tunicatimonas sp. TaxID=1940096 RepID=UPI003C7720CC